MRRVEYEPMLVSYVDILGFGERTVARYLRLMRRRGNSRKQWLTFLQNHRQVTVASARSFLNSQEEHLVCRPLQNRYSRPKKPTATGCPMAVNFFKIYGAERGT